MLAARPCGRILRDSSSSCWNKRIAILDEEWTRQSARIHELSEHRDTQRAQAAELKHSIAANGGDRLERLAEEIRIKGGERDTRREKGRTLRRAGA